ncbi:MAG TPA: DNA polymerase III subunit gamma/tau, partial [Lachnospiraceae bacterium]|nr:DNA polymerase III subunit gamma/tau [Lachnospiraceae bacterium]
EEPPSYVIFILATTEVHKIPVTILSRCQRYDFKRISVDTISERLFELAEGEGIDVEEKAIRYIAKSADGALRDALSLMDQCNSFYFGQKLTYDKVLEVLGAVDTKVFSDLLCAVIARDVKSSISILDEVVIQGRELSQFVIDFTWYLRNLMLIKTSEEDEIEEVLDMSGENLTQLKREAQAVDTDRVMRYIRIFSELSGQIRNATQKRVLVEIAIIKLCRPGMETDTGSLLDRIRAIEEKLEKGDFALNEGSGVAVEKPEEDIKPVELTRALSSDIKELVGKWGQVIARVSNPGMNMLRKCKLTVTDDDRLLIATFDSMHLDYLNRDNVKEEIAAAMEEVLGKSVLYDITGVDSKTEFKKKYPDLSVINMEIETDDM